MEFHNICNEMVAPFLLRHPVGYCSFINTEDDTLKSSRSIIELDLLEIYRLFLNFYVNFYAYLQANLGNIITLGRIFIIFSLHISRINFWHRQWIQRPRFPIRQGCCVLGDHLPFTLSSSHPASLGKSSTRYSIEYSSRKNARMAQP